MALSNPFIALNSVIVSNLMFVLRSIPNKDGGLELCFTWFEKQFKKKQVVKKRKRIIRPNKIPAMNFRLFFGLYCLFFDINPQSNYRWYTFKHPYSNILQSRINSFDYVYSGGVFKCISSVHYFVFPLCSWGTGYVFRAMGSDGKRLFSKAFFHFQSLSDKGAIKQRY